MEIEILKLGELETNCYLVIKEGKCLIIDPGADENYIVERIKNLNVTPIAILITHYHPDHIGAKDRLKEIYGIEEYGYENLFEERVTLFPFVFNVIYTPGHTKDSVCFYFESYDVMFTGDFLFKESIGRTDFETSSYNDMLKSIAKIKTYDPDIKIYPGHGPYTSLEHELTHNKFLGG